MARIQILELPAIERPDGTDETPFAVIIDQADEDIAQHLAHGTTVEYDGTQRPTHDSLKEQLGARAILVFAETVDIVANEVPVGPDGYPLKIRVEGDFEKFREQVQDEIRKANAQVIEAMKQARP